MKKLLSVATLIALGACMSVATTDSDKIDQNEINQWYSVSYSEENGTTQSFASLRIGGDTGTTVALVPPSSLRFNNQEMSKSTSMGTSYSTSSSPRYQTTHEWSWTDNTGKVRVNSVGLVPVAFVGVPTMVSRAQKLSLAFTGEALGRYDEVSATLESTGANPVSVHAYVPSNSNANFVTFSYEDMARLPEGPAVVWLKRTRRLPLQNATRTGGSVESEYLTRKVALSITR